MNYICYFLIVFISFFSLNFADKIKDVSPQDTALPSIQYAIDKGYLSLFQNQKFQGNSPINRREMALILNKLNQDSLKLKLNASDINTLLHFSNKVSSYMKAITQKNDQLILQLESLKEENLVLNHDISLLHDSNIQLKQKTKHQQLMIYGLFLLSILNLVSN